MGRSYKSSKTYTSQAKSPPVVNSRSAPKEKGRHLTVQRLNHDSSWLLSLESGSLRIVLDPWLTGAEIDGFSLFNRAEHTSATLQVADLGRVDAIVVSMAFSDHCHEETLSQLPSNIPIYAVRDALARIKGDARLSSRNLILIEDRPTRIGNSRTSVSHIPTSGLLDFVHQGLVVSSPESSIVYAPHGLILSGPTAQRLKKVSEAGKRISLCLVTASTYDLPLIIGGTVNLGLDKALPLLRALRPKYLIDTHSEQKTATGFVPLVARTAYPSHEEVRERVRKECGKATRIVDAPHLDPIPLRL